MEYTSSSSKGLATIPALLWSSQQPGLHDKQRTYDLYHRKVLTQGRQLPPQPVGRNVLRSSLHLQQVAAHCTTWRNAVPYSNIYGKEADMTGLRAIGSRVFVLVEVRMAKMGDKRGKESYADSARTALLTASTTQKRRPSWKAGTSRSSKPHRASGERKNTRYTITSIAGCI